MQSAHADTFSLPPDVLFRPSAGKGLHKRRDPVYDERIQWQYTGKEAAMEVTLPEMLEARERRPFWRASAAPAMWCIIKATPHNGDCGLRRIFCPNRAVRKMGNTSSIPAFFILSLVPKSLAESPCPIMRCCLKPHCHGTVERKRCFVDAGVKKCYILIQNQDAPRSICGYCGGQRTKGASSI